MRGTGASAVRLTAIGLVLLIWPSGSGPAANVSGASGPIRRDRGEGGVEIEVLYSTPEYALSSRDKAPQQYEPDRFTVFVISMNTHTVDLSGYDMVKISELLAGGKRYAPRRWVSTRDAAHHRSGALIFPKVQPPFPVELQIRTVAGVPVRRFRWAP